MSLVEWRVPRHCYICGSAASNKELHVKDTLFLIYCFNTLNCANKSMLDSPTVQNLKYRSTLNNFSQEFYKKQGRVRTSVRFVMCAPSGKIPPQLLTVQKVTRIHFNGDTDY